MEPSGAKDLLARWTTVSAEQGVDLRAVPVTDLVFDERTILKCRYHCPAWGTRWTCGPDTWGPGELIPLLKQYQTVLVLTGYELEKVTARALAVERAAFAAGYSFALAVAVTMCSTCGPCTYPDGACVKGDDLRPESAVAGIYVMETLRRLGISSDPSRGWLRASFVFLD